MGLLIAPRLVKSLPLTSDNLRSADVHSGVTRCLVSATTCTLVVEMAQEPPTRSNSHEKQFAKPFRVCGRTQCSTLVVTEETVSLYQSEQQQSAGNEHFLLPG